MPSALWLGSYPDGAVRLRTAGRRVRLCLPRDPQMLRQLQAAVRNDAVVQNMLATSGGGYTGGPQPDVKVECLVAVSATKCLAHSDMLTAWGHSERVQREYLLKPIDCYSLVVEAVACLSTDAGEMYLTHKLDRKNNASGSAGMSRITLGRPLFQPYSLSDLMGTEVAVTTAEGNAAVSSARDLVGSWGVEGGDGQDGGHS